jgi:hypothetical protein
MKFRRAWDHLRERPTKGKILPLCGNTLEFEGHFWALVPTIPPRQYPVPKRLNAVSFHVATTVQLPKEVYHTNPESEHRAQRGWTLRACRLLITKRRSSRLIIVST